MGSSEEIIPVVNEQDEIIGYKKRADITTDDIYRVTWCRIHDTQWNILLAQRAFTKKHDPGKRTCAVSGTVPKWETYLVNILKEIGEEIGITADENDLLWWPKVYRKNDRKYFVQRFRLCYDWPKDRLIPLVGEVEQLQRLSPSELKNEYISLPKKYTQGMGRSIETFLS